MQVATARLGWQGLGEAAAPAQGWRAEEGQNCPFSDQGGSELGVPAGLADTHQQVEHGGAPVGGAWG